MYMILCRSINSYKMCLNSGIPQNTQIDRFVENGMPQKIVKTVEYTLKKRAVQLRRAQAADEEQKSKNATMQIPKMCGRLRKIQQQHITNLDSRQPQNPLPQKTGNVDNIYTDFLASGVQLAHQFLQRLNVAKANLQHGKLYTVLTKTTQPAHLIAVCILVIVLFTVCPHLIEKRSINNYTTKGTSSMTTPTKTLRSNYIGDSFKKQTITNNNNNDNNNNNNIFVMTVYLGAFAIHFGAQIWMTFVSGLSLYFSLPRHTFGQCQQILFPKYFALNAILSIAMLILFAKHFVHVWSPGTCLQFGALALSAIIEVTVRLYLAPPMLRLMHEKYKIEGAIGSGQEVGNLVQGDLAQCPHYQRIHSMFRRIHMTIAIGNMIVLVATCLHLHFLASKIQIC